MKRLNRHYDFICSIIEGSLSLVFQIQYYDAGTFVRDRHWGISVGWWWPPFLILRGER